MKRLLIAVTAAIALAAPAFAGDPVIGMRIILQIEGEPIASGTTDLDGRVSFSLTRDGVYELSAPNWHEFTEWDVPRFVSSVYLDNELVLSSCLCRGDAYASFGAYRQVREVTVRIEYSDDFPPRRA